MYVCEDERKSPFYYYFYEIKMNKVKIKYVHDLQIINISSANDSLSLFLPSLGVSEKERAKIALDSLIKTF